jgi:flagellin-like protein
MIDMISSRAGKGGVSPILAILILIAITIVVAGVAAIWFFGFANTGDDSSSGDGFYIFNVSLNGNNENVTFSIISGQVLNTSDMKMSVEGNAVAIPSQEIGAGTDVEADTGLDLQPGEYYRVKITVDNSLFYDNKILASA